MRLACPLVSAAGEPSSEQTDIEILYAKVTRVEKLRKSSSTNFSVSSQPAPRSGLSRRDWRDSPLAQEKSGDFCYSRGEPLSSSLLGPMDSQADFLFPVLASMV